MSKKSHYNPKRLKHNHQRKLVELVNQGKLPITPGAMHAIEVAHDDWCALINNRGPCNCDPDIRVRWHTGSKN